MHSAGTLLQNILVVMKVGLNMFSQTDLKPETGNQMSDDEV